MTALDDPLSPAAARPIWLMTLADLALLLVGFLVLIQATTDRAVLVRGLRTGFGAVDRVQPDIQLAAAAAGFAPGSAQLADPAPLVAWTRDALRDPRASVTITGAAASSEGGVLLAADRARAVIAALVAAGLPADRLQLATARGPARATLTLALIGEPARSPS